MSSLLCRSWSVCHRVPKSPLRLQTSPSPPPSLSLTRPSPSVLQSLQESCGPYFQSGGGAMSQVLPWPSGWPQPCAPSLLLLPATAHSWGRQRALLKAAVTPHCPGLAIKAPQACRTLPAWSCLSCPPTLAVLAPCCSQLIAAEGLLLHHRALPPDSNAAPSATRRDPLLDHLITERYLV